MYMKFIYIQIIAMVLNNGFKSGFGKNACLYHNRSFCVARYISSVFSYFFVDRNETDGDEIRGGRKPQTSCKNE